jgi:hypothetical protein
MIELKGWVFKLHDWTVNTNGPRQKSLPNLDVFDDNESIIKIYLGGSSTYQISKMIVIKNHVKNG